ncbi:hypothetical protein T492DRAFT_1132536 [Pavlovales sp. CCMP2436]|nr:hypothetical protein T492DRAFT_1132536 [Pavlovales sp. CCMP2436]
MGRGSVPAKTHARRVAPFDELGLDGSLTPSMQAECDCAFRVVEKHRALRSSELLAALSVCGFSLSERELLEVAGPELLAQPQLSRADFQTIYLRLTATDLTLDQSVRRAFGIFDDDQAGRLDHSTLRRVLAAAAGSDEAAADRRIAALGIGDPGVLDVAEFVHELRASLVATAELSAHARKGDGLVGLSLEVDRERCEEEERLQYAAELAELQPELAWHLSRLRPQVDGVALELDALFFTLLTDLGFATGESRFEAPQAAEELLGQLARALVACAVQLHARGKAPLQLSLEVHTQDTHPEAQMAVLSLRRAEAARGVLRRQLRASWPAELLQAGVHDGDVLIEAVGHGGSMLLNRRALEVRVLSPDEARRARVQAALSPAAGEAGGAAGESAGVSEGEAYGEELARVQAEAERRIGSRAPLVSLDLLHLSVRTERQWLFLGDRAEYVDGPSEAELIGQVRLPPPNK